MPRRLRARSSVLDRIREVFAMMVAGGRYEVNDSGNWVAVERGIVVEGWELCNPMETGKSLEKLGWLFRIAPTKNPKKALTPLLRRYE